MKYQEIIDYLKTQEKELKANNLEAVYHHISPRDAVYLTKFFLNNGLDPLKYLTHIPAQYAYNIKGYYDDKIILPQNIQSIDLWAFGDTFAKELYIPSEVYYIRKGAFSSKNLKSIYIDGSPVVGEEAFFDCTNVTSIKINCSKKEWYKHNHKDINKEDWPLAFTDCINAKLEFLK